MKKKDILIRLVNLAKKIRCGLITNYCFLPMELWLRCMSIHTGKKCRYVGMMLFHRAPESTIKVGGSCTFRSAVWSNMIGINRPCSFSTLKRGAVIIIGDRCGFSATVIGAALRIELGDDVRCGANTTITDTDWHENDLRSGKPDPVIIEDNVWLGLNVTVLKGVRIGRNSVIAAGSVVTSDIPENVIAGGVPARVIKALPPDVVQRLIKAPSRCIGS
jgi:hypothetical protein